MDQPAPTQADELVDAIEAGDLMRVTALLNAGISAIEPDSHGTAPLYAAAEEGNAEIVRALLRAGADPNAESRNEESYSLFPAATSGHVEIVRVLLAAGADPNAMGRYGPPLGRGLFGPDGKAGAEIVRELVARGADLSLVDSPLYGAGPPEVIRALLEAGADPNREARGGEGAEGLPLCFAACWGSTEMVSALLEGGADPDLREDDGAGSTALCWAAWGGYDDTVETLLEAGADPNVPDGWGRRPLSHAVRRGLLSTSRLLLAAGADARASDEDGTTALDVVGTAPDADPTWLESQLRERAESYLERMDDSLVSRHLAGPYGEVRVEVDLVRGEDVMRTWGASMGARSLAALLRAAAQ